MINFVQCVLGLRLQILEIFLRQYIHSDTNTHSDNFRSPVREADIYVSFADCFVDYKSDMMVSPLPPHLDATD
jgi:hypothetical protein